MKHKKAKFNGSRSHSRAILHMIGQSVDVFNSAPTVSEIADWMNVCKRTATKYLKRMEERQQIIMLKEVYKNTFRYRIELKETVRRYYADGNLELDYRMYAQQVMKVILT